MQIQKTTGKAERRALIGMITRKRVIAQVANRWGDGDLFQSKWANVIAQLCVEHFNTYGKAPRRSVEALFETWATSRKRDQDTVAMVEKFLTSLSSEYENSGEEHNDAHTIDLAGAYFNEVRLRRLVREVDELLEVGKGDEAHAKVIASRKVNLGLEAHVDVLQDKEALYRAFKEKEEPLLQMPDALGHFFTHSLKREAFISFLAPEKVGKTTWLVELAWRAMVRRLRVAFFSCGDESEGEMMLRFAQRATRQPLYPTRIKIPTLIEFTKGGDKGPECKVTARSDVFEKGLGPIATEKAFARVMQDKLHSEKSYLRLMVHAAGALSVKSLEQQLDEWEQTENWVADVVVVDYMENLEESGNSRDEPRHRISATWREMRALSMRRRVLVLTATQANAAGATADVLTREHFSESKTKLAHVTGMIGINQSSTEKENGVQRLNWIVRRGAYFNSHRACYCAGAYGIQCPVILSHF